MQPNEGKTRFLPSRAARDAGAMSTAPRFYSVAQVARILGMSSMTVYRAIADGQFPALKVRGRLIVPAKAIDEMTEAAIGEGVAVDAASWVVGPER
jgi:excisionase family DNA binding protein